MLHSFLCLFYCNYVSLFSLPAEVSFQCVFGAQRLMTTCFPTDMFNQRLIRGDRHIQLCWFDFSLYFLVSHIYQSAVRKRGAGTKGLFLLYECCWMFVALSLQQGKASLCSICECFHFLICPFFCSHFERDAGRQGTVSQVHLTIDSRLCLCRRS